LDTQEKPIEYERINVSIKVMTLGDCVVLAMDKPVDSVAFTPQLAREVAGKFLQAANQLEPKHKPRLHRAHGKKEENGHE
jgi:hypothetical protein